MIDLRIGNPDLIIENINNATSFEVASSITAGMPYNKNGPMEFAVDVIKKLHEKYHPNLLTPNCRIVVASGASQLISAFWYLNKRAYVQSPFWFRTPLLALKQNSEMIEYKLSQNDVNLVTYPNNPDGELLISQSKKTWYDSVYLWPWYFDSNHEFDTAMSELVKAEKSMTIFTLSKMTGHCGTRFGWAITEDHSLADKLDEYLEFESGGLSFDAQNKASAVINALLKNESWQNELTAAQKELNARKKILEEFCIEQNWLYRPTAGMFAWITTNSDNAVEKLASFGIVGTCGSKCGGSKKQIRLNLAVTKDVWNQMLKIIGDK